jgi:hypothetical protein
MTGVSMSTSSSIVSQGFGIALAFVRRRRRRSAALQAALFDGPDYELVFPEGPQDRGPGRHTAVGRRIAPRS